MEKVLPNTADGHNSVTGEITEVALSKQQEGTERS